MNRLLSDDPSELIIYKIIVDGLDRHAEAFLALDNYIENEIDEGIVQYYNIMNANADALADAYKETLSSSAEGMKSVSHLLKNYLKIAAQILDDISICKLTDDDLDKLTVEAGCFLDWAEEDCRACLEILHITP